MPGVERELPDLARRMDPRRPNESPASRRRRWALGAQFPVVLLHTVLLSVAMWNVLVLEGDVATGRWFAAGSLVPGVGILWVASNRGAVWTWRSVSLWFGLAVGVGGILWLESIVEEPTAILNFKPVWYPLVSALSILPLTAALAAVQAWRRSAAMEGSTQRGWRIYAIASILAPAPFLGVASVALLALYVGLALAVTWLLKAGPFDARRLANAETACLSTVGVAVTLLSAYVLWRAPGLHAQVHAASRSLPSVQVAGVAVILALTAYLARSSRRPV